MISNYMIYIQKVGWNGCRKTIRFHRTPAPRKGPRELCGTWFHDIQDEHEEEWRTTGRHLLPASERGVDNVLMTSSRKEASGDGRPTEDTSGLVWGTGLANQPRCGPGKSCTTSSVPRSTTGKSRHPCQWRLRTRRGGRGIRR